MMKVCHLTSVHDRTDGRIFSRECSSLQKAGYHVTLIAADGKADEEKNGIYVYGIPCETNRLSRMLKTTKNVYKKALEIDADIYHFHDPELISTGIKLKKKGKKVIFDSHEDVPLQILGSKEYIPLFIRRIISTLYVQYEKRKLPEFDAVISVSPDIVDRLKKINQNTFQVTNYPEADEIIPNTDIPERAVCFTGLISPLWNHKNIVSSLVLLDNVKYNLAGPVYPKYLQELQKLDTWNQVNFAGKLPREKVPGFIKNSAAGMALCDYSIEVGYNMGTLGNTKLFEYMREGLPLICTDFILWKQIVDEEKCGICVNPRDINSIAEAINKILSNPEEAKEMGRAGQRAVKEKYNWKTQEKILLDLYRDIQK